jgi:WD40 repeat protein
MNERTVFLSALEKQDPAQRQEYMDEACAGDPDLRNRIETLLRANEREGKFLDVPAPEQLGLAGATEEDASVAVEGVHSLAFLTPSDKPGSLGCLDHYEIQEVIGKGGMGMVLKAFDDKLHRVVAIKVMAAELATTATARQRFTREAQAAAAVSHDHIVTIHAVEDADPLPYLVMQYVSGLSLQQRLDRDGPLDLPEILRIGMQTASGLAAAHAQGLIHRDIKPANILLENGVERVKITDFGLARAATDASLTQTGTIAGTPQYMSPEQAEGKAIDQRTDLFSLGSVLYAMCTGRAPFRALGSMAVLKRICEDKTSPIREGRAEIPEWLVEFIDRLHAKDPAERFQSATEVADLLRRYLAHVHQPAVSPLPPPIRGGTGTGQEMRSRGPGRRRWVFAAAVLFLIFGSFSLTEATGVTRFTTTVMRILRPDGTLVVEVDDPDIKVTVDANGGLVITGAGPHEIRLLPGSYRLQATKDGKPIRNEVVTISRGDKRVVKVRLESAGRVLPAFVWQAPPPGPLDKLDPAKISASERFSWQPKELVGVLGEHRARMWSDVPSVAYSPDGKLAASGGSKDIFVWDAATMRLRQILSGHKGHVLSLVFLPDKPQLLSASMDATIRLWDIETGQELRAFRGHTDQVVSIAYSAKKRQLLSGSKDETVRLWNVDTGELQAQLKGHGGGVGSVAFSPDGTQALSGSADKTMRLWDVDKRREMRRFDGHTDDCRMVAFLPDGRRGLSCSHDSTLRLWDLETRQELRCFKGHKYMVFCMALSPDGRRAVSGGYDRTIRMWDVDTGQEQWCGPGPTPVSCVAFSPSGGLVLAGNWDGTVRRWDTKRGQEIDAVLAANRERPKGVAFSPEGRRVLALASQDTAYLWDVETGMSLYQFTVPFLHTVRFADKGSRVVCAGGGGIVSWDAQTGKRLRLFENSRHIWDVALSGDGRRAVSAGQFETVQVWDVESGQPLHGFREHIGEVHCAAVSPDGRQGLTGGQDRMLRFWDLEAGRPSHCLRGFGEQIVSVAYSPDGRIAASGENRGLIRLWDLTGPEPKAGSVFRGHADQVLSLTFSPDAKRLASCDGAGQILLRDVLTGEKLRQWRLPGAVYSVAFAPDGRHLATFNGNGTVYILRLAKP